ncbi:MAG: VWA domain-containing protein, partial [Campylobacterota bacterium]|nr:VWA domain-containing protein [Campylobacterota bacterium]
MTFLHPNFLYFVLPPLFILFGFLLTQKESQSHFFSDEVMGKLRVSANSLTLKARNALFLVVGFFMVIALAEPVIKDGVVEVKAKSADIMIALDISDSMLATDVYPNRLNLAKQKALSLLDNAPNERIGIVAFAKNSYLVSPLSFDHGAVSFLLRQLDTSSITQKGTDYIGILDVISKVKDDSTKKYLLILSDGGDSNDFSDEIAYAKEKNIVVFVLGIGTKKGAPIKLKDGSFIKHNGDIIVTKLNENISELATKSGGVYIQNTTSDDDIKTMLREIENMSEERELKSQEVQKYTPLFYYPLAMAILFLLIATSSVTRRIKTSIPSILIVTLLVSIDSKAGMLDFMELQKAQEFYKSSDYKNSAITYENHAKATENGQSYYNAGNSYYKDGSYDKALQSYQKATFKDKNQRAKNYSNIGNTHIK